MNDTMYTVGELALRAGVTVRTVRFYTAEGLLPLPGARGKYAFYSDDHLQRLRLIARLKASFLPLNEIKARIGKLSADEVLERLAEPDSLASYSPTDGRQQPDLRRVAEPMLGYRTPPGSLAEPTLLSQAAEIPPAPLHVGRIEFLPELFPLPEADDARDEGRDERRADAIQTWRRIALGPGVELHLREPLTASEKRAVEQLLATARRLFANGR